MPVTTKILGETKNKETVKLYLLENKNGVKAGITDLGAIWINLWTPDRDGNFADVVLGYDTIEALSVNEGHLGAIVGRNANRIGKASFSLQGKTYQLKANNGENNLHSGPDCLEYRMYAAEIASEEPAAVTFSLKSPEGDQGYPGEMDIAVTYQLTDDNALHIRYELAAHSADTLANFTNHAYFNLGGHASGTILDELLWIDADAITAGGADSIPHGELIQVEGTAFDFRTPKAIGRDINANEQELFYAKGYDHNFCLNHKPFGAPDLVASAVDPKSGRKMDVLTDMPGIQFYAGNCLHPAAAGKDGVHYAPRGGFALETQYYPNAINVPAFAQPVLRAGEKKIFETIYRFGLAE